MTAGFLFSLRFYYYPFHPFHQTFTTPAFLLLLVVLGHVNLLFPSHGMLFFPIVAWLIDLSSIPSLKSHLFSEAFPGYLVPNPASSHPLPLTSSCLLYVSPWNTTLSNISFIYLSCTVYVPHQNIGGKGLLSF